MSDQSDFSAFSVFLAQGVDTKKRYISSSSLNSTHIQGLDINAENARNGKSKGTTGNAGNTENAKLERKAILAKLMDSPLREIKPVSEQQGRQLVGWLAGRSLDEKIWVSDRALLYDEARSVFDWQSESLAIRDLREAGI